MKNESKKTREILKLVERKLQARYPKSSMVILKHSDRFTKGVPDVSITLDGVTTWFEFKALDGHVSRIQYVTLQRLVRAHLIVLDQSKDDLAEFVVGYCLK